MKFKDIAPNEVTLTCNLLRHCQPYFFQSDVHYANASYLFNSIGLPSINDTLLECRKFLNSEDRASFKDITATLKSELSKVAEGLDESNPFPFTERTGFPICKKGARLEEGFYYTSLDMKSANFQILHMLGVVNTNNWSDWVTSVAGQKASFFAKSKKERQYILGSIPQISPRIIQKFQSLIMGNLVQYMIDAKAIDTGEIVCVLADEILLRRSDTFIEMDFPDMLENFTEETGLGIGPIIKREDFTFCEITSGCGFKTTGSVATPYKVPSHFLLQYIRKFIGEQSNVLDRDCVIRLEGTDHHVHFSQPLFPDH